MFTSRSITWLEQAKLMKQIRNLKIIIYKPESKNYLEVLDLEREG